MTTTVASAERFIETARKRGLVVEPMTEIENGWTIKSEFTAKYRCGHALFVYAAPGARGGRLAVYVQGTTTKLRRVRSRSEAVAWLATLAG